MSPAIRALLVLGLVTLAAAAVVFVAVLVLLIWYSLPPGFNEYGDINEYVGVSVRPRGRLRARSQEHDRVEQEKPRHGERLEGSARACHVRTPNQTEVGQPQ